MALTTVSEIKTFGGTQGVYRHTATSTKGDMEFSVFTPGGKGPFPVVWYLSGLTCTQENVTTKAGFQRMASELGLMIVCPDTSPRGDDVPNDDNYDFGQGAGFYVNATEAPWSTHFRMYDYVVAELPALIKEYFPADMTRQSITGHSMGGHGALTIYLKNRDSFKSVSAFAPIVAPIQCPWGEKAFTGYLGSDKTAWADYDACELLKKHGASDTPILIDQGTADTFLEGQLKPHLFEVACQTVGQALILRMQEEYDHSYYFIATVIEDHLKFHAKYLK